MLNTNKLKDLAGCFASLKCFVLLTILFFDCCVFIDPCLGNEVRVRKGLEKDNLASSCTTVLGVFGVPAGPFILQLLTP